MIPYVFVSSTIDDLHHLRETVRDALLELAYHPVLSEYGDVGYLPTSSAVESCYLTVRECQLAVVIVGKRYGNRGADGISITQHEFRAARDQHIPVICLADKEVLSYRKVFDANKRNIAIPGMDDAAKTFAFIQEVVEAPLNNAILPFLSVSEARSLIKTQIAHFIGDFLRRGSDPLKAEVKEVLAEIKTLRHELTSGDRKQSPNFIRAVRLLLEDRNDVLRNILETLYSSFELGITDLLSSGTFVEFVQRATGALPEVVSAVTFAEVETWLKAHEGELRFSSYGGNREMPVEPGATLLAIGHDRKKVYANRRMLDVLDMRQAKLQHSVRTA